MLDLKPRPANGNSRSTTARVSAAKDNRQPRRLALALVLLLVTFTALIIKDRDFWFGSDSYDDADISQPITVQPSAVQPVAKTTPTPHSASAPAARKRTAGARETAATAAPEATVTATRAVLPPLDVEVVAGDSHHTVHPGSNALSVEIIKPGVNAPINASERQRIIPAAGSYDGSYPLLAQQMRIQGSVVLQAFIGPDGVIQNLRVISGPGILASAAEQAIREWRFRPIVQKGQAVESTATITVNFTIKVADSSPKTTIAESRADDVTVSR